MASLALLLCVVASVASFLVAGTGTDEIVTFNTHTLKYHCVSCRSAVQCTKSCIDVKKSVAIARGGVPCKNCGGSCTRQSAPRESRSSPTPIHVVGPVTSER